MASIKDLDVPTTAAGALAGALSGAGISWFWNKWFAKKKRISALKAALVGAGVGGVGGALLSIMRKPYTIDDTAKDDYDPSDRYYHEILVGGAGAGGTGLRGISYLPFGPLSRSKNKDVFRHDQKDEIQSRIDQLLSEGKHPRVWGHSWGGKTVAEIANKYKDVEFHALDPVSWTGVPSALPDNLTIHRPKHTGFFDEAKNGNLLNSIITHLGRRWPIVQKGGRYVEYEGSHVRGLGSEVERTVNEGFARRDPQAYKKYSDDSVESFRKKDLETHHRLVNGFRAALDRAVKFRQDMRNND